MGTPPGLTETGSSVQPAGAQQESRLPEPGQQRLDLGPPDGERGSRPSEPPSVPPVTQPAAQGGGRSVT